MASTVHHSHGGHHHHHGGGGSGHHTHGHHHHGGGGGGGGSGHHSHFAHHVRTTRAWGIEPGWKFVSRETQQTHHRIPIENNDSNSASSSAKLTTSYNGRPFNPSSSSKGGDNSSSAFETRYGVVGASSTSSSSSSGPFGGLRGTSFRLPSSRQNHYVVASRSKTDDDCPVHSSNSGSGLGARNLGSFASSRPLSSTLPRSLKPSSVIPSAATSDYSSTSPSYSTTSSASSSSSSSSSSSPPTSVDFVPPGVLKKPGSSRGPKHMKKVAFLENAEFSRGVP